MTLTPKKIYLMIVLLGSILMVGDHLNSPVVYFLAQPAIQKTYLGHKRHTFCSVPIQSSDKTTKRRTRPAARYRAICFACLLWLFGAGRPAWRTGIAQLRGRSDICQSRAGQMITDKQDTAQQDNHQIDIFRGEGHFFSSPCYFDRPKPGRR